MISNENDIFVAWATDFAGHRGATMETPDGVTFFAVSFGPIELRDLRY